MVFKTTVHAPVQRERGPAPKTRPEVGAQMLGTMAYHRDS